MRFWDPSDPDIAAADQEPWSGVLASAMRPISLRAVPRLVFVATLLSLQAPATYLVLYLTAHDHFAHPEIVPALAVVVMLTALTMPLGLLVVPPRTFRRLLPMSAVLIIFIMGLVSSASMWSAGPDLGFVAVLYLEALPFAFYVLRLNWALLMSFSAVGGCALVVMRQDGWPAPGAVWLIVASTVLAVAWLLGIIAQRADNLAVAEREARIELADVNRTLEDRVASQVSEIEQLGRLRRFLSPQVADGLLSDQAEQLQRPHRARIAVVFADLRGFTAFTNKAEPEEVVEALDSYYRIVGALLQRHGATIGDYAGDGIMAYFGDPVPHDDPAPAALAAAREMRAPMKELTAEWRRLGFDLGWGVGVAYGYATLGVVGFDGRYDYTPLGAVVNLAARLCGKAGDGEVLVDHATYAAAVDRESFEPIADLELKGFAADTCVYRLQP